MEEVQQKQSPSSKRAEIVRKDQTNKEIKEGRINEQEYNNLIFQITKSKTSEEFSSVMNEEEDVGKPHSNWMTPKQLNK